MNQPEDLRELVEQTRLYGDIRLNGEYAGTGASVLYGRFRCVNDEEVRLHYKEQKKIYQELFSRTIPECDVGEARTRYEVTNNARQQNLVARLTCYVQCAWTRHAVYRTLKQELSLIRNGWTGNWSCYEVADIGYWGRNDRAIRNKVHCALAILVTRIFGISDDEAHKCLVRAGMTQGGD